MSEGELAAIVGELRALSERLDDVALDALRRAAEAGATARPPLERRVTRARHAIERAIALLGGEEA
ncbi:MAG TPA: hypothetical protein VKV23_06605 [Acidimicrobiales bacterium]|nr:hypothetical protein [Acidimicrobiales bacterium]